MNFSKNASQATKLNAQAAKSMSETLNFTWGADNIEFIVAPCPEFGKFAIAYIKNGALAGWYSN